MDPVQLFLANIWFGMLGLILGLYVITDGFTLGAGILFLAGRDEGERDQMMNSLGSVWDANETWLVLFGGALFGAFPLVYGVVLHALYIPVMAMLFGFIFRGISFDYREQGSHKRRWNIAFAGGSLLAALAQGFALGGVLDGMAVNHGRYTGGVWGWATPFAALVALGVVCGYALLGATYLIAKTEGDLQRTAYRAARWSAWLTVLAGIGVSVWTPLRFEYVADRWFAWPAAGELAPLPLAAALAFWRLLRALRRRREVAPFVWSVVIFACSLLGLAASLYPFLVPPRLTIYSAASSAETLVFMLVGIGLLIPVMLIYNAYQYLVFRGKVRGGYGGD